MSQVKNCPLGAHIYCPYLGTLDWVLCDMDAAKLSGVRARVPGPFRSLNVGHRRNVELTNAWCIVRHVLRTCRMGISHLSFGSSRIWSPVNQGTPECSLQPVDVPSGGCSNSKPSCSYRAGCDFWCVRLNLSQIWTHYQWKTIHLD